jgi:glycosyltransferase involved in cell wall biosynthesis
LPKILFLTTHNLATNPRLVKEIKLALQHNYKIEVICYIFRNWSYELNNEMMHEFQNRGAKFHCIEAGRKHFFQWFAATLKEKTLRILSKVLPLKNEALANSVSRRNIGLLEGVTKITSADWVIGHNPGALWATLSAGKKLHCKTGFDVEDYHPGEGNDRHLQKLTKQLMQRVLPEMDYVSFAAPLIMEELKKDIKCNHSNWFTVLNYFPSEEFALPETPLMGPLRLVWFSQNISFGRGLELILPAVESYKGMVELHLYGNVDEDFKKLNLEGIDNILLHGLVSQQQLHRQLARYDVGLALEPAKDKNNDLAVSNKLLSYLQAGLYVIATNTLAQENYLLNLQSDHIILDISNKENNIQILNQLVVEKKEMRMKRKFRFLQFKEKAWEVESKALTTIWNQ